MKKNYAFLLICFLQISLFTTNAQCYWSDTFASYEVDAAITGMNNWLAQNSATGFKVQSTSPLTYGNLLTDQKYLIGGSNWTKIMVSIPVTSGSELYTAYNADAKTGNMGYKAGGSNELWFSALVRADGFDNFQLSFASTGNIWYNADNALNVTRMAGTKLWGLKIDGTDTPSTITSSIGDVILVVCKLNFESDGTRLSLYLNPTVGTTPTTPAVTGKTAAVTYFKYVGLSLGNGSNMYSIDEMRLGATYADVTPDKRTTAITVTAVSKVDAKVYTQKGQIVADLSALKGASVVSIIDTKGVVVKSVNCNGSNRLNINVANQGVYFVRVQNDGNQFTQKVVL